MTKLLYEDCEVRTASWREIICEMNWNQPYEVLREENYIIRMQVPKSYDRNGYKMVSRKRASKP